MHGEKIHGPLQRIPLQSKVLSENDERNKKHGKPRSSYSSDKHNVAQNGQVRAERYRKRYEGCKMSRKLDGCAEERTGRTHRS